MAGRDVEIKDGRNYAGMSKEQRIAQRQTRMIDAALELFGTQGYAATSIERLCAVANVSTRSFYEDMGSREALLIALVNRTTSQAFEQALVALTEVRGESLSIQISAGFRAYLAVTCRDRRSARVCYLEVVGVSATVEQWRREQRKLICTLFVNEAQRALERGEIAPRRFDLFAMSVVGAVNQLAQELVSTTLTDRPVSLDEICEEVVHFVNSGLGLR